MDAELHPFAPESVDVKKQDFLAVVFVSVVENVTFNSENVFVVVVVVFFAIFNFRVSNCIVREYLYVRGYRYLNHNTNNLHI